MKYSYIRYDRYTNDSYLEISGFRLGTHWLQTQHPYVQEEAKLKKLAEAGDLALKRYRDFLDQFKS